MIKEQVNNEERAVIKLLTRTIKFFIINRKE